MKLKIKVIAGAKKKEVRQDNGFLKVKLTAQPVKGKANEALIEALSTHFKTPKSNITITHGHTSNKKEVEILG